jgi:serine/threonine protein kinase
MSEPLPDRNVEGEVVPVRAAPTTIPSPAIDLLLGMGVEPSDETPTIISKQTQEQLSLASGIMETLGGGSISGRSLAHFEMLAPIGVGGMAAVIRARDKQLDRQVALKILPPDMATDPENVRRFHQEARAAAKLDHENIARVFFCGEDQRLHFIAFEFVEGVNLRTLLEQRGRLAVGEAIHYMLQIATGLAHAAARGVVHRDIKPSNIIISPNGRAKLVDMGLARSMGPTDTKALTQSGVTLGTFDYISPEQALEPRDADVRSDIYSLGCTFYHMLTGQPPVPEGTAAKKLHHHQHVAPTDPRQFNPAVPDEVAAILGRMMAKDPKDRYQRAEHLVQHLIHVAQKLGATTDVPDGVLFVDAAFPTAPRKRPVMTAAFAALALAFVLLVLSFAPSNSAGPAVIGPPLGLKKDAGKGNSGTHGSTPHGKQPDFADALAVNTERELLDALADQRAHPRILIEKNLALGEGTHSIRGGTQEQPLTIEARDAGDKKPVTVQLEYTGGATASAPWGGLVVEGGWVTFRNLHFELHSEATPRAVAAAVLIKSDGNVRFERCTFTQKTDLKPLLEKRTHTPIASVAIWNPVRDNTDKPHVVFEDCFFRKGQAAVSLTGSADVEQQQCAYARHGTLFHLRGQDRDFETRLRLKNVSAHVVNGPAFRLDDGATCKLRIEHSVFSCSDRDISEDKRDQPVLIRQTDTAVPSVIYEGRRNCYHALNAMWVGGAKDVTPQIAPWDAFKKFIKQKNGYDESSTYLERISPWANDNPLAEDDPRRIFALRTDYAELRHESITRMIGVEHCAWGIMEYAALPSDPARALGDPVTVKLKPYEKIVDPAITGNVPGVFATLSGAIGESKPGDTIFIKHTGPLHVADVTIDKDVTLRPYGEERPVLMLAPKARKLDATLFNSHHGQLKFEQLEFHLKPEDSTYRGLSVVHLSGNGHCQFKQCVFTFEAVTDPVVPMSAVTLLDSKDMMMMPMMEPRLPPELRFQHCIVRGPGDAVVVRASRPFDLEANQCLIALSGSFVSIKGAATDPQVNDPPARIRLTRLTTYLHEHLCHVRANDNGKGLLLTKVDAEHCLFAAAAEKALVYFHGLENEDQLKQIFAWEGGEHNAYSGYSHLLEVFSATQNTMAVQYGSADWRRFSRESNPEPRFDRARFDGPMLGKRPLHQCVPDDFRLTPDPKVDWQGYGASLDQLPRLQSPAQVEAKTPDDESDS